MKEVGTDLGALDIEVAADGRANVVECGAVYVLEADLLLALSVAADHREPKAGTLSHARFDELYLARQNREEEGGAPGGRKAQRRERGKLHEHRGEAQPHTA